MSYKVKNGTHDAVSETATSAIQAACEILHGIPLDTLEKYTTIEDLKSNTTTKIATAYLASGGQPFYNLLDRVKL